MKAALRSTLQEILPDSTQMEAFVDEYLDVNIQKEIEDAVNEAVDSFDKIIKQMRSRAKVESSRVARRISRF